jgi:hypothetical protein
VFTGGSTAWTNMLAVMLGGEVTPGRVVLAGLVVLVLAGCAGGPSEEERRAGMDLAWQIGVDAADDAAGRLPGLFPALVVEPFSGEYPENRWSSCSSSSTTDSSAVQLTTQRDVRVEPPQETVSLVDGLAASLVADGWEAVEDPELIDDLSVTRLRNDDGFHMRLLGRSAVREDGTASVRVLVYSPCLLAPEDADAWTPPTDASTPTATPTG